MTKKELVEKLKDYPDDMEVYVSCEYEGDYCIKDASRHLDKIGKVFDGYEYVIHLFGEPLEEK